CQQDYSSPRTF
nr:immunoglobulin light chain junction region [Mus musculus]NSL97021.1 immunoglobulin light chain junction region [Mus musculus]NSL97141.1 immunoglobulin light chain junction region [Mus musculus]NSL97422.1 immunoglobulin light chain junction region [Mus musculus]NSL97661.1 immunoglobulin light chain junction region [Mus musculus]